jgi:GT2 family glycosyltransferase
MIVNPESEETNPLVSIILPVWNGEKYLESAILSILNQQHQNIELIIVDDASTDNTSNIISKYLQTDHRITAVSNKKNLRLPESLNNGFRLAKGHWHTWTSDDNILDPNCIKRLLAIASSQDSDFVYTDYRLINEDGRFMRIATMDSPENLFRGNCVGACFIYRNEIFKTIGNYDSEKFMYEDYDYWVRILQAGFKMIYAPGIHPYSYRLHKDQLSSRRKLPNDFVKYRWELLNLQPNKDKSNIVRARLPLLKLAFHNKMYKFAFYNSIALTFSNPIVVFSEILNFLKMRKK